MGRRIAHKDICSTREIRRLGFDVSFSEWFLTLFLTHWKKRVNKSWGRPALNPKDEINLQSRFVKNAKKRSKF
jgi:hypothetical protein